MNLLNRAFNKDENPNKNLWMVAQRIESCGRQIFRLDGSDKIIEFLSNSFGINKVKINMLSYDNTKQKGDKKQEELEFYLDFADVLVLCDDILNNNFAKKVKYEKMKKEKDSSYYYQPLYQFEGGNSAEALAERGKSRKDGKPLFRRFKIIVSTKSTNACAFQIEKGPGKKSDKGGIIADYASVKQLTGPDDAYMMIAISPENLKRLAVVLRAHINAYISAQYMLVATEQESNYLYHSLVQRDEDNREAIRKIFKHVTAIAKFLKNVDFHKNVEEEIPQSSPSPQYTVDEETGEVIEENYDDVPF